MFNPRKLELTSTESKNSTSDFVSQMVDKYLWEMKNCVVAVEPS